MPDSSPFAPGSPARPSRGCSRWRPTWLSSSSVTRFRYAISHGLNPLYSSQIGAPAGYNLAWTTPAPAVAVILSPVTAAFGPITSFNLTLLLAAPVSAWAAFLAARRLTSRFWAALAAGAVYGFSWYEVAETGAGHPNLYVIMLLPLMVYLVLLWRDGKLGSGWFVGLTAVAMAAEFYISNETFAGMTVLWAAGLLYALRHSPPGFTKVQPAFSLNLESLVNPNPWSGIVLLVIVLALAVLTWSSRLTRLLVIGFVLIVALAIGPVLVIGARQFGSVPWERLWYLPVARSAEPLRLMIFANLVLAIIVALWLALPVKNGLLLAARWILGLAAVAGIIAYVPTASRGSVIPARTASAAARPTGALPAFLTSGRYRDYLRPGEIVVVVSDRGNASMLFQADTDFYVRIAGGFINRSLSTAPGRGGGDTRGAGLVGALDERLQPDGPARHAGGRRDRLPDGLSPVSAGQGVTEVLDGPLEAFVEPDGRLPPQDLAGAGDVGAAPHRIVRGQRALFDRAVAAGQGEDLLGQLEHG